MPAALPVAGFYLESAMSKKTPNAPAAKTPAEQPPAELPAATDPLQDEFAGQGGSYSIDPATNKRIKNQGE